MKKFLVEMEYSLKETRPSFKERVGFTSSASFKVFAVDVEDVFINRLRAYTSEGSHLRINYLSISEALD